MIFGPPILRPGIFRHAFGVRRIASPSGVNIAALSPFAWYDSSVASSLYDATSGGSVTAATGNVRRWEDLSGNGRHLLQAGATAAPTLTTTSGIRGVLFDGVDDAIGIASIASALPVTVFVCWTPITHTINESVFHFRASGAGPIFRQVGSAQMSMNGVALCGRAPLAVPSHAVHKTVTDTISARINRGDYVAVTQANNPGTSLWLGATSGASAFANVRIHEMIVLSGVTTDAITESTVAAYFERKWGMTRPRLMIDGNSISSGGVSLPLADVWPTTIAPEIPNWDVVNWAVSGQNITAMAADAAMEFGRQPLPTRGKNVIVAWELVNQLISGASANGAAAAAAMKTYCQARRAEGYTVIALTMLPTNSVSEANWNAANAAMRETPSAYCDDLVDVAANATIGPWGSQNNATYYNGDKLHLTAAGQVIVKDMIKAAVLAL